ncbi:MAG: helix-turn-helix domain-containing protein [Burkholderiales bacterium]|nr:helix-turn-helix domain-containing protein [Burkholderiales bacterium]
MPARAPVPTDPAMQRCLEQLGQQLRERRQSLRIAAGSVAAAAQMSRQTLHRIEHGEPSVTMGAYLNVLRALGLRLQVADDAPPAPLAASAVETLRVADYPQLQLLAWHRAGEVVTAEEALALYERNWRHVDRAALTPAERDLIHRLAQRHGQGALLV